MAYNPDKEVTKKASKKANKYNDLTFNIYGIRQTSNPKYFSLTLCAGGENEERKWINTPIKASKVAPSKENGFMIIKVKLLEDKTETEDESNELPF